MNTIIQRMSLCLLLGHTAMHAAQVISVQKLTAQVTGLTQANIQSSFISRVSPLNDAEVVLVSKAPATIYVTAYTDKGNKKQFNFSGTGTANNIITLQPNEVIKLSSNQDFYLQMSSNQFDMGQNDASQINAQLKDARKDRNWIHPQKGSVYALYYNNKGLVPGLLKSKIDQGRIPTAWGKLCALQIIAPAKDANAGLTRGLSFIALSTLDQVMRFEQSKQTKK